MPNLALFLFFDPRIQAVVFLTIQDEKQPINEPNQVPIHSLMSHPPASRGKHFVFIATSGNITKLIKANSEPPPPLSRAEHR